MRLEALVERFMGSGCAELRDRVFGLVGLANDVDSFALDIPEPPPPEPTVLPDESNRFRKSPLLSRLPTGNRVAGSRGEPRAREAGIAARTPARYYEDNSDDSMESDASDGPRGGPVPNENPGTVRTAIGDFLGVAGFTRTSGPIKRPAAGPRMSGPSGGHGPGARDEYTPEKKKSVAGVCSRSATLGASTRSGAMSYLSCTSGQSPRWISAAAPRRWRMSGASPSCGLPGPFERAFEGRVEKELENFKVE